MEKISALVRRDLKRMMLSKAWLVMMVVQPTAYLVLFALALSGQFKGMTFQGRNLSYLAFILPGLLALQTNQLFHILVSLSSADRRFGVFSLVMMAGTKPREYIISQVISHTLITAMECLFILLIGWLLLGHPTSFPGAGIRAGTALAAWLASVILWSTVGIMIGLRIEREEKRDVLWALLNLPLMFSSSVFYDVRQAPAFIRALSYANPLTYCADVLRTSMYGDPATVIWKVGLLAALACICAWLCHQVVRTTPLVRTIS